MRRLAVSLSVCAVLAGAAAPAAGADDFGQEVPSATPGNPGKVFQSGKDPTADEYGVPGTAGSGSPAAAPTPAPNAAAAVGSSAAARPAPRPTTLRVSRPVATAPSTALPPAARATGDGTDPVLLVTLGAAAAGLAATAVWSHRRRRRRRAR